MGTEAADMSSIGVGCSPEALMEPALLRARVSSGVPYNPRAPKHDEAGTWEENGRRVTP
jgi:hypothetical protein